MVRSKRVNNGKKTRPAKGSQKARKLDTITTLRALLPTHRHLYLFHLDNARSAFFQRVRRDLAESTVFFFGKNKVLQKALSEAEEASNDDLLEFAKKVTHNVGLVVSQLARVDLEDKLAVILEGMSDYGRAGSIAPYAVKVEVDPATKLLVKADSGEPVQASSEPILRAAGVPTMLRGGQVLLAAAGDVCSFDVCEAGQKLTVEQAKVLRVFGVKVDDFNVRLVEHLSL